MNTLGWNPKLVKNYGVNEGHDKTNNWIERLNEALREGVRIQRGWKRFTLTIPEEMRIQ